MAQTKRLNFDISPEQEDELNWLRTKLGTSTTKDTVLRAIRVLAVLSREAREGAKVIIQTREGETVRLMLPELEHVGPDWTWLVQRAHPWRRTPAIKGRRILASTVWRTMLANSMTAEEVAEDLDLPLAAVREAIGWSEANQELIELEAQEEQRWLEARGVQVGPPAPR